MNNLITFLLILSCQAFSYFGGDAGDVMKDGHKWKTIQINAYYQISGTVVDSLMLFQEHWDSVLGAKCGEDYHPATLADYWNTQFEYMEHMGMLYQYAGTQMGVGQGVYQMPSLSTDTVVGGFNYYSKFIKRLTIEARLATLPVNNYSAAGFTKYDSINNIPFNHYMQSIVMQPSVNIACISNELFNNNLLIIDTIKKIDTVFKIDTLVEKDTIKILKVDTLKIFETINETIHDTIKLTTVRTINDTITVIQRDTVFKTITDTLHLIDTLNVVIHDTVNTCKDGTFAKYSEKLFKSIGSYTNDMPITISEISGNNPSVEVETNSDISVEVYVYDNLGVAVTSGTYVIKSSINKQYVSFNGYAKNGVKVPNGVYLMRIVSGHNNMISNNVYRIGIRNRVAE